MYCVAGFIVMQNMVLLNIAAARCCPKGLPILERDFEDGIRHKLTVFDTHSADRMRRLRLIIDRPFDLATTDKKE